jgi:hypothetical protein
MRSGTGGSAVAGSAGGRRANGRPPRGLGQRARWERWRDPCGKLAGSFGDGSRTIRGGFEGRLVAEARLDQAGDPGGGAEPGEGRERPVGTVAGSFRRRFENDSRTIRERFEDVLTTEAP